MSETALIANAPLDVPDAPPRSRRLRRRLLTDSTLYVLLTAMVVLAWSVSRLHLYDSKSDLAYWLGVSGGVSMLLLFTYPMRKHLGFMRRSGPAGVWFMGHMVLGVAGPFLILLHSGFQIGSLNAGVAFYSMVIVALSGVVGRFLYLRVHRGLNGRKLTLEQVRARLGADDEVTDRLRFAPKVMERCMAFERWALERRMVTGAEVLRAMLVVPWVRWHASQACWRELRRKLLVIAHQEGWSRKRLKSQLRGTHAHAAAYLAGAQRVAMFSAWDRLFSWWHVAHVPFVYLLVLSAVVHVVAVHAY